MSDDKPQRAAGEPLGDELYELLRRLGRRLLGSARRDAALDPTEVAHECYLRLLRIEGFAELKKTEFLALASTVMRRLLVDQAKQGRALKRSGGQRMTLSGLDLASPTAEVDMLDLDDVLQRLAARDERQARIVELRFFGGLGMDEIASQLGISRRTVTGEWAMARAFLRRELEAASR